VEALTEVDEDERNLREKARKLTARLNEVR